MVTSSPITEAPAATERPSKYRGRLKTEAVIALGKKYQIPGDKTKHAIAGLPEEQRSDIWWFAQWCDKHDLGTSELGTLLKKPGTNEFYSADSVKQLLSGARARRDENIDRIHQAIVGFRKIEEARSIQVNSGFIETRLFFEIEKRCLKALHRQKIQYIFGDSQIGKTESLKEVKRRHNHGQTLYLEVPTGGTYGSTLRALATQFSIPAGTKVTDLKERIFSCIDGNMLLIFDEAHNFFTGRNHASGLMSLSFIREMWNRCKCGVVLSMTNEGRDYFLQGKNAKALEQLWRRRITPLQLPNITPDDDLALFAQAYGLGAATDAPVTVSVTSLDNHGREKTAKHTDTPLNLQTTINKSEGLGVWISILQDASDMAAEQRRSITWGAVIKAACLAQADAEILK